MNISVFYENLYEGALVSGLPVEEILLQLRNAGMDSIYLTADS